MRSSPLQKDLNPIIDEGAPNLGAPSSDLKSVDGINTAARLSDLLGVPFFFLTPRSQYVQGFGSNCSDPQTIIGSWSLSTTDIYGKRLVLPFDLIPGDTPLLLGLDTRNDTYRFQSNSEVPPYTLRLSKPDDDYVRVLHTYYASDEHGNLRYRIRIFVNPTTPISSFFASPDSPSSYEAVAKNIHRFTHAHPDEVKKDSSRCQSLRRPYNEPLP